MDTPHEHEQHTDTPKEGTSFFSDVLRFTIIALAIVLPIRVFVAQPFIVSGSSMDPTFTDGQYLIVDEISYRLESPERGDVVIFRFPKDRSKYFIKRVIGLPGETIEIQGNAITVRNTAHPEGVVLEEPYAVADGSTFLSATLQDEEYFVLGDNRPASSDSRSWGVLPRKFIVGRAFLRLLPVQTISVFPGVYHSE